MKILASFQIGLISAVDTACDKDVPNIILCSTSNPDCTFWMILTLYASIQYITETSHVFQVITNTAWFGSYYSEIATSERWFALLGKSYQVRTWSSSNYKY